jgi:hypothetical protein
VTLNFTCTLCGERCTPRDVSFVHDDKVWTTSAVICTNEKCLEGRGATSVDLKATHALPKGTP